MADAAFTGRQKRSFKRNGFLVRRDVLEEEVVERASDAVWEGITHERDDHEALVETPERGEDGEWPGDFERCERYDEQFDPLELHGPAGTVVFWHGTLQHCGGVNRSRNLRLAAIQRFSRTDADEIKREAFANPTEYHDLDDVDLAP